MSKKHFGLPQGTNELSYATDTALKESHLYRSLLSTSIWNTAISLYIHVNTILHKTRERAVFCFFVILNIGKNGKQFVFLLTTDCRRYKHINKLVD